MLQPAPPKTPQMPPTSYSPARAASVPIEQGTIGRTVLIKGEVSGSEPLYIDGSIEGSIHFAEHRVTVGRHGNVTANIRAKEVVIMGSVKGNIECTDRVDIRAEGSLTGDVVTRRISVEDGAVLKGSVQVQAAEHHRESKSEHRVQQNRVQENQVQAQPKALASETGSAEKPKAAVAGAGA